MLSENYKRLKDVFKLKIQDYTLFENLMYSLKYYNIVNSLYTDECDNFYNFENLIERLEQKNLLNATNVMILQKITRIIDDVQLTIYYERYEDFLCRYQAGTLDGTGDYIITDDALTRITELTHNHQYLQSPYPEFNKITMETIVIDGDEEMDLSIDHIGNGILETDSAELLDYGLIYNAYSLFNTSNDLTV